MRKSSLLPLVVLSAGFGSPAFAHHPMGGRIPATFMEGLLSGLAHPVIGPDHLLVIVAVGLLTVGLSHGAWLAGSFVAATLLGTALHLARLDIPAAEVLIAGTVVLFGTLMFYSRSAGRSVGLSSLAPIAVGAGVLHGYAYGEAIVGAGASPLVAYLLGFCAIQAVLVLSVRYLTGWIATKGVAMARVYAISGTAVSILGVALVIAALNG
jgi:urease accessory protein